MPNEFPLIGPHAYRRKTAKQHAPYVTIRYDAVKAAKWLDPADVEAILAKPDEARAAVIEARAMADKENGNGGAVDFGNLPPELRAALMAHLSAPKQDEPSTADSVRNRAATGAR